MKRTPTVPIMKLAEGLPPLFPGVADPVLCVGSALVRPGSCDASEGASINLGTHSPTTSAETASSLDSRCTASVLSETLVA